MKSALVTGATGFVGRHIAAELDRRHYSVDLADVTMNIDAHDVFRSETWVYDLVVHAAAVSPHREAIDTQPGMFPANVALDAGMFRWAARTQQRRVLYFSSSAVYPIALQDAASWHRGRPLREHDVDLDGGCACTDLDIVPMTPDSTYGWTKFMGEKMATAARRAEVPVTVVRPFSGYGEDQSSDFPFRALVERARRLDDPFVIWGDGAQVRDWIHIDDLVAGALALVDAKVDGPVNLCSGRGTSMRELAQTACYEMDYRPTFEYLHDKPAGVPYRVGDPTTMRLFYTPQVTLEDGVKRALLSG